MIYMEQKPGQICFAALGKRSERPVEIRVLCLALDASVASEKKLWSLSHQSGFLMPTLENQPSSHAVAEMHLVPLPLLI